MVVLLGRVWLQARGPGFGVTTQNQQGKPVKIRSTINCRRSLAAAAASVLLLVLLPASTLADARPASVPAALHGEMQVAWPNPLPAVVVGDQTGSRVVVHAFSATGTEIPARARAAYQRATLVMRSEERTSELQ